MGEKGETVIRLKHIAWVIGLVVAYKAYAAYVLVYRISDFISQMVSR